MPLSKGVIPCEDVVKKFLILPTAKIYRKWNNPLQEWKNSLRRSLQWNGRSHHGTKSPASRMK
jgi:hypothetical protein